jgi:hypothetical protein
MSPRSTLRVVAAFFIVAGLFLLRLAMFEPAGPDASDRIRGSLARVEFPATPKLDEWCLLTLTSGPTAFALREPFANEPILRSQLAARLIPGVEVELDCPPEKRRAREAEAGAEPRSIRRISANGALLCDVRTRRGEGLALLHCALFVAAVLALGGGVRAYRLSSRMRNLRRPA